MNNSLLFINGQNATILENVNSRNEAINKGMDLSGTCFVCSSKEKAIELSKGFSNIISLKIK